MFNQEIYSPGEDVLRSRVYLLESVLEEDQTVLFNHSKLLRSATLMTKGQNEGDNNVLSEGLRQGQPRL